MASTDDTIYARRRRAARAAAAPDQSGPLPGQMEFTFMRDDETPMPLLSHDFRPADPPDPGSAYVESLKKLSSLTEGDQWCHSPSRP